MHSCHLWASKGKGNFLENGKKKIFLQIQSLNFDFSFGDISDNRSRENSETQEKSERRCRPESGTDSPSFQKAVFITVQKIGTNQNRWNYFLGFAEDDYSKSSFEMSKSDELFSQLLDNICLLYPYPCLTRLTNLS